MHQFSDDILFYFLKEQARILPVTEMCQTIDDVDNFLSYMAVLCDSQEKAI